MKIGFCKRLRGQLWPLLFVFMAFSALAKHGSPPNVEPVVYEGVRYVVPNDKGRRAYVEAWDIQSGRKLWTRTIFRHWYVPLPFGPTECMYYEWLTSMEQVGDRLVFTSERGRDYTLDPRTKTIRRLRTKDPALTRRVPDSCVAFVCGGSLTEQQAAELSRASTTTEYS